MVMLGESELKTIVRNEAAQIKNLELIDHVDFFKMQEYFNQAICLVNTSAKEGFPNTFIQACIGSTPILSYNVDPDSVITDNKMGLLCSNSSEAALQFIYSLDSRAVKAYGENAFEYVQKNHDLINTVNAYELVVRELMACAE